MFKYKSVKTADENIQIIGKKDNLKTSSNDDNAWTLFKILSNTKAAATKFQIKISSIINLQILRYSFYLKQFKI